MSNVGNKTEVKKARVAAREIRDVELNDIRTVLGTISGRRLLWRLLEHCKTFNSVWEPSAKIHYNSGMQDIGHFIMSEIVESDSSLLFKMMKESENEKQPIKRNRKEKN